MTTSETIDLLALIATLLTPVIVGIFTYMTWRQRNKLERLQTLEEKLREDRISTYFEILRPFEIALAPENVLAGEKSFRGKSRDVVVQEILTSLQYRQAALRLVLMSPDNVVESYNRLWDYFYRQNSLQKSDGDPLEIIGRLGEFWLEIRKGLGNEETKLTNFQMMIWMINDLKQQLPEGEARRLNL